MLNNRENILKVLREKPLKIYEVMKRADLGNEEACQSLLLKMRDEGLVKFDVTRADGSSGDPQHCSEGKQPPSGSDIRSHESPPLVGESGHRNFRCREVSYSDPKRI